MHVDPSRLLMIEPRLPAALKPPWRAGDVLLGKVIGALRGNSSSAGASAVLQIGNTVVSASSRLPLQAGQQLRLSVTAMTPQPVLRVLPTTSDASPSELNRVLAQALPRQAQSASILRLLRALPQLTTATTRGTASPAVSAAAERVVNAIPSTHAVLRAQSLAQALTEVSRPLTAGSVYAPAANAGPATPGVRGYHAALTGLARVVAGATQSAPSAGVEPAVRVPAPVATGNRVSPSTRAQAAVNLQASAQLNSGTDGPPRSVTATTDASPAAATRGAPNTLREPGNAYIRVPLSSRETAVEASALRELVDGALARVRSQQLLALHHNPANPVPVAADLPVRWQDRVDLWHFEFDHADDANAATVDGVRIRLLLQFDEVTTVTASIALSGGRLQVTLDSSAPQLRQRLKEKLNELSSRLTAQGLSTGQLTVGALPAAPATSRRDPLLQELA